MKSHKEDDMPPSSRHADGQPDNPSHGDRLPHHHVHPSVERRFNRDEAPVEIHRHLPEKSADEIVRESWSHLKGRFARRAPDCSRVFGREPSSLAGS